MILIAKDAFFKPKKFFHENLLPPSFTYDDTLLSCKKSEKINDPIFHKVHKNRFLAVFWPKFAQKKFFFENRDPSHSRVYSRAPLYQKSENFKEPISRKAINERTDERTNTG